MNDELGSQGISQVTGEVPKDSLSRRTSGYSVLGLLAMVGTMTLPLSGVATSNPLRARGTQTILAHQQANSAGAVRRSLAARYEAMAEAEWFKAAHRGRSLGDSMRLAT